MPPAHVQTVRRRYEFSPREKWILGGVLSLLLVLVVAVAISFATAGHRSANGCVDVALPYSTGGSEIYRCGPAARVMCSSAGVPGGYTGDSGRRVADECRKAGLKAG